MRIIDPGHKYAVRHLDGQGEEILTYVKREGPGYPGNIGHHPGMNLQDEWRAQIDRLKYLDNQEPCWQTKRAVILLREAIEILEKRAAERHGRKLHLYPSLLIEHELVCLKCGHIGCDGKCSHKSKELR